MTTPNQPQTPITDAQVQQEAKKIRKYIDDQCLPMSEDINCFAEYSLEQQRELREQLSSQRDSDWSVCGRPTKRTLHLSR